MSKLSKPTLGRILYLDPQLMACSGHSSTLKGLYIESDREMSVKIKLFPVR